MEIDQSHRLFASIGKISAAGHSFEDTVDRIMKEIELYFQPTHCSLLRLDPNSGELFFASILGLDMEKVKNIRLKLNEGIAGTVAAQKTSYFVPDTQFDPTFTHKVDQLTGFITKSIIAVPLVYQNTTYGVIEIVNRINGIPYTDADHLILQTIADFAAISLYNSSLFEMLRIQAHYDTLTGLFNRARLNLEMEMHLELAKTSRREHDERIATVITLDLDDFKHINDTYGHREGDNVLKDFSANLKLIFRNDDLIFRIGGDEFLVIIYSNNQEEVSRVSARINAELKALDVQIRDQYPSYGFSFGFRSGSLLQIEEIINKSDLEMYNKKKNSDTN